MKFEEKTYYKLCSSRGDEYKSMWTTNLCYEVNYNIGFTTYAPIGTLGLFVFSTIEDALKARRMFIIRQNIHLFECRVKGPVIPITRILDNLVSSLWQQNSRMSRKHRHAKLMKLCTINDSCLIRQAPAGTLSVAAVQLVKET